MSNEHKGKTAVKYDDLEDACSFVSAAGSMDAAAYLCRESGKVYFESDEFDDSPELPENIGDIRKFVTIPDKFELGLGQRLVFRFIREILPEHYDHVSGLFRRRGAYARFKDYLFGLGNWTNGMVMQTRLPRRHFVIGPRKKAFWSSRL